MIRFHLVSSAHIDPVWQWRVDEAMGATISTFSAACDFCEEYDNYVFCHNEAILYKWIENNSPKLFERIKKLVHLKKWNIMGGWYLQPDCNLPSGEGMIRQIKAGLDYFKEKFGDDFAMPKTVTNFDCPGCSPGIAQIMNDFGYDSLLYIRGNEIERRGFKLKCPNGEVYTYRANGGYVVYRGTIRQHVKKLLDALKADGTQDIQLCPWGVGNHGGGASREDLNTIEELKKEYPDVKFIHSTPDAFFEELKKETGHNTYYDIGNANQGTYSAEYEVKKLYNRLENDLFKAEKMAAYASLLGKKYPYAELRRAEYDMIEVQFHDSITGTTIREVEDDLFNILRHGLEEVERVRRDSLYYILKGEKRAKDGEYPIFIFNPHPFTVKMPVDCEIMLADQQWDDTKTSYPVLYDGENEISVQVVRESSSVPLDWRKRISFDAEIAPFSVKRFSCYFKLIDKPQQVLYGYENVNYVLINALNSQVKINKKTGLIDSYIINGSEYVEADSCKLVLIENICDPWGFAFNSYKKKIGEFRVMTKKEISEFLLISEENAQPVKVIEDGKIKTVVESYFIHRFSRARVVYTMYKSQDLLEINIDLFNNEKDCKLKLSFNTPFTNGKCVAKTCYNRYELHTDGDENVSQDYILLSEKGKTLSVINFGVYGSDCKEGQLNLTLLTGCGYSAEPIGDRQILPNDRFSYRMDQSERNFRFILKGGDSDIVCRDIERINMIYRQPMSIMNFFPVGEEKNQDCTISLSDPAVTLECLKFNKKGELVLRLFNSNANDTITDFSIDLLDIKEKISLKGLQYKTFIAERGKLILSNAMEERL